MEQEIAKLNDLTYSGAATTLTGHLLQYSPEQAQMEAGMVNPFN